MRVQALTGLQELSATQTGPRALPALTQLQRLTCVDMLAAPVGDAGVRWLPPQNRVRPTQSPAALQPALHVWQDACCGQHLLAAVPRCLAGAAGQLRRLKLGGPWTRDWSHAKQLTRLTLNYARLPLRLALPELQALHLRPWGGSARAATSGPKLILDCPKLSKLKLTSTQCAPCLATPGQLQGAHGAAACLAADHRIPGFGLRLLLRLATPWRAQVRHGTSAHTESGPAGLAASPGL